MCWTTQGMLVMLMFAGGCTSSHMVSSWRNPDFAGPIEFKKTLVLIIHPDPAIRHAGEEELVGQIGSNRAVAAYEVLNDEERKDIAKLKDKLQTIGADGVVTMRVASSRLETMWVSNSRSPELFNSDFTRASAMSSDPGYLRTDRVVRVETKIYSVSDGKLIWSGLSDTLEPSEVKTVIAEIAKAVGDTLRKQKMLRSVN